MKSVGIIGGGINGLLSAYYLKKEGCDVTVIEQGSLIDGCSLGNAGMIVPSHIIPLAQPGMIAKGLRWMMSATSPFYIKPRFDKNLLKWGWLFWRHSTEAHVQYSIPVLRDISLLSKQLFKDLAHSGEMEFGWQERGLFMLFKHAEAQAEMAEEAHFANEAGIEAHLLSGSEVQAMEPDVQVTVQGAVYYPGDAHLSPNRLIEALVSYLRANGVWFLENIVVEDFETRGGQVKKIVTNSGNYTFDELVIASGAWSPKLTECLGISLPLQGGKGYSFMVNNIDKNVKVPAIMLEARATATPMGDHLRFAGTMEIAGTDLSVNMNRVRGIYQSINQYYPDIQVAMPQKHQIWKGLRPCSPDGLPYIGRIPHLSNVTLATGHGMMGISLGPATGKLVSEIVTHQKTSMDIQAFNPVRFS
ncbi:MAG: FAD-dependent oxidoreductase [Spirosomataceae bacterium]